MHDMTKGVCALCNHNRVIRCWPVDHGHGSNTWNIAAAQSQKSGFLGSSTEQHGLMVTYVCQRCGFVMWFADNPGEIPIGKAFGTELIEGPPAR